MNYRVYGNSNKGWKFVKNVTSKDKAIEIGQNLNPKDFSKYMIIEHNSDRNEDIPIIVEILSDEHNVKFENEFYNRIRVNPKDLKPIKKEGNAYNDKSNDKSANER